MDKLLNNEGNFHIKHVAMYLRKSRGDEDSALDKHELELKTLCQKKSWNYIVYKEIGTSDSIDMRPQMVKLLSDVDEGLFDAVVVMDIDRLSRGDEEDRGRYLNIFRKSETYIVTPSKIYDLDDDNDDLHLSVKGLLAREEYKAIKTRLSRGKKLGSRQGNWTNGVPPYPYEYERWKDSYNEKGLVINKDKQKIYRYIIDSCVIHKKMPNEIAWELNRQQIPSPRGVRWQGVTVNRILQDETHLGKIISNKSKGDAHKIKKANAKEYQLLPKSEWVIVENCHEACKTQFEHENILIFLGREKKTPSRAKAIIRPLSGLVKCANCGHTMMLQNNSNSKNESLKPCWHTDEIGNKCGNRGGITSFIYTEIDNQLSLYEEKIKNELIENEGNEVERIQMLIDIKIKEIEKKESALARIYEAYEDGVYEANKFRERKQIVENETNKLEEELRILMLELKHTESMTNQDRLYYIHEFQNKIQNNKLTSIERNELYKSIIDTIIWKRIDDDIEVSINFL